MGETEALLLDAHRFGPAAPEEEYVYGSCSPGWHAAADHERCITEWIANMESAGIERVCCLMAGHPSEVRKTNLEAYRRAFGSERVLHAPIPQRQLADPALLNSEILPFLHESRRAEEPVVVHCLAGLGRTGQVLAAWIVDHRGYHPEEAVETVRKMGRDPVDAIQAGNATKEDLLELLHSVGP